MSVFSRLTGVFFDPKKAFEDIGKRPTWLVPLALIILATLVLYYLYGQHVGWDVFLKHQMEINPKAAQRIADLPAAQREQTLAMQAKFTGVGFYVFTVIITPIMFLISAAILLAVASGMMGAGLKFKQVYAIACWASLPMVVKQILSMVVLFLKNPEDVNITNPLAFNPAAFMDQASSSKFLYALATGVDLFFIWIIFLVAVGLKEAAGKRLTFGSALTAAIIQWAVPVLIGASLAGLFG